jgi:hypothetical protein
MIGAAVLMILVGSLILSVQYMTQSWPTGIELVLIFSGCLVGSVGLKLRYKFNGILVLAAWLFIGIVTYLVWSIS